MGLPGQHHHRASGIIGSHGGDERTVDGGIGFGQLAARQSLTDGWCGANGIQQLALIIDDHDPGQIRRPQYCGAEILGTESGIRPLGMVVERRPVGPAEQELGQRLHLVVQGFDQSRQLLVRGLLLQFCVTGADGALVEHHGDANADAKQQHYADNQTGQQGHAGS